MTIRQFIDAFIAKVNPELWHLELRVVTRSETVDGKTFNPGIPQIDAKLIDGATLVFSKPIKSVTIGDQGCYLIHVDPNNEPERQSVFLTNAEEFSGIVLAGTVPKCLEL